MLGRKRLRCIANLKEKGRIHDIDSILGKIYFGCSTEKPYFHFFHSQILTFLLGLSPNPEPVQFFSFIFMPFPPIFLSTKYTVNGILETRRFDENHFFIAFDFLMDTKPEKASQIG